MARDATFSSSLFIKVEQTQDRFLKSPAGKANQTVGETALSNENEKKEKRSLDCIETAASE